MRQPGHFSEGVPEVLSGAASSYSILSIFCRIYLYFLDSYLGDKDNSSDFVRVWRHVTLPKVQPGPNARENPALSGETEKFKADYDRLVE